MQFPVSPASVERVLALDGKRYFLASAGQVEDIQGITRSWQVKRIPRQEGDPTQEFTIPLGSFHDGYGFTFADRAGVYEMAAGWDLSAPGKAITYPRMTTAEAVTSSNYRGWIIWDPASGYMYMLRGSYGTKYLVDDTTDEWPIQEYVYFGANIVVAGRPALFQGRWYVPMVDVSTPSAETLSAFWELNAIAGTTVTEVQTLSQTDGSTSGGTWTATFNDGTTSTATSNLAWNASANDVQTALRLIPGLGAVTVVRTGSSPQFVWTVTMTGAPSVIGTASPPQFTAADALTPSGTIVPATSIAGTGDHWVKGDPTTPARTFTTWQKPTVGPVLVRANENMVSSCGIAPTTAANWGTEQPVGDSGANINALETLGRLLFCGKEDGVWSFDETGQAINEIPAISAVRDPQNCVGMREYNGFMFVPHKLGLIRWRPGASWSLVGAEQEGFYEGERSVGWGSVVGLAPYGKYLYQTANDLYDGLGIIASLQSPGGNRGPLTPHMHQAFANFVEDCAVVGVGTQPTSPLAPTVWSDDSAVGTRTWSNPSNAADTVAFAEATSAGQTHYLKGLNPNPQVPSGAVITGIRVRSNRQAVSPGTFSETRNFTGSAANYVVPTGVTSITVDVRGAQGGASSDGSGDPGLGGRVQAVIPVTPGETLSIRVGGAGGTGTPTGGTAGSNGGARGGTYVASDFTNGGGGGGGMTYIRRSSTDLVVAGGGGGASRKDGGAGGGTTGSAGQNATAGSPLAGGGGGGTQSAGGAGGTRGGDNAGDQTNYEAGVAGSSLAGGSGGDINSGAFNRSGGGGGGGYFGGGGAGSGGGAGGGGGSSYSDPANTGTVHTQGFQTGNGQVLITGAEATNITDTTVRLVKAGTVVGSNLAAAGQWPQTATMQSYGSGSELWGTTWSPSEVNASTFGVVFSDTVTTGTARRNSVTTEVFYTVTGVSDPGSFLATITLDATRTIATPFIYRLPRSGLPVANDPNIPKQIEDARYKTARYAMPSRSVQKEYRSTEFFVDLDPEENTPGFQLWASVEDGTEFPLLDENGDPATVVVSGDYELFFPPTAAARGRWVQVMPTVPALTGEQVPVSVDLRDLTIHGAWRPKMTQEIQAVVVLREGGQFEDGYTETRSVEQQLADLQALHGEEEVGGAVSLHDPIQRTNGYCVVTDVQLRPVRFKQTHEDTWVGVITLRKSVYS